eukprot:624011-Prymnesium_polylepis.1
MRRRVDHSAAVAERRGRARARHTRAPCAHHREPDVSLERQAAGGGGRQADGGVAPAAPASRTAAA